MKRLIINSDDYGRTTEISRGIREAHLRGVVTSTTCMMNIPTTPSDVAIALKETPKLGMGVHLVLTMGMPILPREEGSSITDEDGNFFKLDKFMERVSDINSDEVKTEWHAQIEAFIKASGREPTHLDSHHHSSYFTPELFSRMLELAKEYECAIRFPFTHDISSELEETSRHLPDLLREFNPRRPDAFYVDFYDEGATQEELMHLIKEIDEGTSEIMCHPGHIDDAFVKESTYNKQRERELKILTDPSIRETIQANGIKLITFAEI